MIKRTRSQAIKYTLKGRAYLTHYHTRLYLDEVMRVNTEIPIRNKMYCGCRGISNTGAYLIGISDNGEEGWVTIE